MGAFGLDEFVTDPRFIGAADETHLKRLEDVFGAVLVGLFCRKLRFLKLQKLAPEDLQIRGRDEEMFHRLHRRRYSKT